MAKTTKKTELMRTTIKNLVMAGKSRGEILETLEQRGFKGVKASQVSYYLYGAGKKSISPTPRNVTTSPNTVRGFNLTRIKSILDADFLTDADRINLVKREIFPSA
jgi:hypothetical protein